MKLEQRYSGANLESKVGGWHRLRLAAAYLSGHEVWIVGLLVAGGVASNRLLPIAVSVAAFFWLIRRVGTGTWSVRTAMDWPVVLLGLVVPVTLWATALPDQTIPQVTRLLAGMALFYSIVNWAASAARIIALVYGSMLAGLGLAIMAPFSVAWATGGKLAFIPEAIYQGFPLLFTDSVHPNVLAGFLTLFLALSTSVLTFAWRRFGWLQRVAMALALLVMVGILILTKSRGAWIAFAGVLVLLAILRWRWGWLALAGALGAAIVGVASLGVVPALDLLATSDTISGMDSRIEIWSRAIYMIQDFPFTGIGMGSFTQVADMLYPFFLAEPGTIMHAHNLFLQIPVDVGIPGFTAWLAILLLVVMACWRVYRHGREVKDEWIAGVGTGLLASQLALTIHGLTDAVTWGLVRPSPLIWALWGTAMAAWRFYGYPEPVQDNDGRKD